MSLMTFLHHWANECFANVPRESVLCECPAQEQTAETDALDTAPQNTNVLTVPKAP